MKRYVLIFFILIFTVFAVCAEETQQVKETIKLKGQVEFDDNPVETIYLDETIEKPQVNIPQKTLTLPAKSINITTNTTAQRSALARAMVNRRNLEDILPLNGSVVAQNGGFSYGSTWGEELSYAQMEATTAFFLRYDSPKKYSIETSIRHSASEGISDSLYSSFRISPEWHITDRLTLKNTFTNYLQSQKNKGELTIVYTPILKKYADSLKFELGVAQSYYANGNTGNSVKFSTGFKL